MTLYLPVLFVLAAPPAADVATELRQVAPDAKTQPSWLGPPRAKDRAVVLLPGLYVHPFRPSLATLPHFRPWQEPTSDLVRALAKDADVFAFGYAQTTALDDVAQAPGLRNAVTSIRKAGYREVVLIGHSAGGVIARLFAEANPDAGITKVITVAAPHSGSELANLKGGIPKLQAPFVQSLSPESRAEAPPRRLDERIEMACVVCKLKTIEGDLLVSLVSQWPEECRKLGVPVVLVSASHFEAMTSAAGVKAISDLAREKLARWTPEEVERAKKVLFRDPEERVGPARKQ
jgi:pimeloyl-ACP methyl ester carboxylesterase